MNPSKPSDSSDTEASYEQVHLEDYWRVVRQRAWMIALTTILALVAAYWSTSRRPQLWRSSLTLEVSDPRGRMGHLGDQDVSSNMLWTDPVESELQQLSTTAVARWVVDSLQLRLQSPDIQRRFLLEQIYINPGLVLTGDHRVHVAEDGRFLLEAESGESAITGQAGRPIGFPAGTLTVQLGVQAGSYRLRVITQEQAESMVTGGLAASVRPETNLIDVTYTGTDPELTEAILNAAAASLSDLGVDKSRRWARKRTQFIQDRLLEAGDQLSDALQDVERYKQSQGLTSLSAEEMRVLERISTLQTQLETLIIERGIYTSLVAQVTSEGMQPGDIQQFALLSEQELNRTVQFYYDQLLTLLEARGNQLGPMGKDPAHPDVVGLDRTIADTQGHLLKAAENAVSGIDSRIDGLRQSLLNMRAELRTLPSVETELAELQGKVEIYSDTYEYLLARYQESRIAEAEIMPYVDVLDPARRPWPVSGRRRINVILGALLGLFLGVGAAFFLEYIDRSVQTTAQIEASLGTAVLGWIPLIDFPVDDSPIPLAAINDPEGSAAEAYRVLRTNLAFSTTREEQLNSIVFTSPGPAEGKSTTAANLAAVLAARGDRTLLVDADLRRGALHGAFDVMRSPGLSDLLVGELDAREAIRPSVITGLDFLPAGQRPPNPSELLGSQAMADLLATWSDEYRWVLLDAPPVLAVADATVLAALSDGSVLIVRAGETDRRAGWRAIQQLKRVGARVIGSVLNVVKPGTETDKYYLDYYYERA
ncbi:MAG: polysaccharide biosynthesis tyrosine autokinase [Acidimicrobiia bacterium]